MIAVVLLVLGLLGVFGAAAPAASADGIVANVVTTVLGIPAYVRGRIDPEGTPCIKINATIFGTPVGTGDPGLCLA